MQKALMLRSTPLAADYHAVSILPLCETRLLTNVLLLCANCANSKKSLALTQQAPKQKVKSKAAEQDSQAA
jgi:hypothetical protein